MTKFNEFQRFQLKVQWDAYIQAKMAGAKDLEEVDNWMIDLQNQGKKKPKNKKRNKSEEAKQKKMLRRLKSIENALQD